MITYIFIIWTLPPRAWPPAVSFLWSVPVWGESYVGGGLTLSLVPGRRFWASFFSDSVGSSVSHSVQCCCVSLQFSSVAQLCPTLCDPMNRSTPGLPVHHKLPEFTQTHVH